MKSLLSILMSVLLFTTSAVAQEMSADDILQKVDALLDVSNSKLEFELLTYRDNILQKTYRVSAKYQEWDYVLAETLYPPRNEGEKTLRSGKGNMWTYLPKINKVMRVSEGNSFSNSDFSNMDILKPTLSQDYTATLLGIEDVNGEPAYKLELAAKSEDVAYAKILYWIRQRDIYPLQREYYTFSGHLLKRLSLQAKTDLRGGIPDFFVMTDLLENNKYSTMQFLQLEPGQAFPSETFRKDALMKR